MCGINPQAYLADVLNRIAYHPIRKIETLLPGDGQNSSACQIVAPDKKNRSQRLTLTAKQTDIAIKQATRRAALADNTNSINAKK